ncbi:MAG: phosphatidate cytidylyltransferase [Sedimentisphaerales bacterium]|jgi:phosphatidate cytidylyltransferase|nr:phosphatidate cytidylyltransferase [Sedimentisphaerales bacterium]NLT77928.1 phosphatidate cytidylyltransferase [Planctomycetota bacterium]
MLKHRIFSGILMTLVFGGLVILDGWLDGSATAAAGDDRAMQGTVLTVLVAVVVALATVEFAGLAAAKGLHVLLGPSVTGVVLLSTAWYWPQWFGVPLHAYVLYVLVFALLASVGAQYRRYGTDGVLANCGVSGLAVLYLGLLAAFVVGIRVELGLWEALMLMFVVKFSDIGAFTFGKLFGRHKFSPRVSPGKTWEGLAGAMIVAVGTSLAFAVAFDIMAWPWALVFGGCFAVIGQLGDLTESMMKRDAQQKDSANRVPGFGGILDVIDSPLVAAPFGYLFFRLVI